MLEKAEIFHNIRMLRIMVEIDPETRSFAVQYETEDIEKANQWANQDAKKLFGILHNRYGEKLVHFTTPMEIE